MNLKLRRPLLAIVGSLAAIGAAFASGSLLANVPAAVDAADGETTFTDTISQEQTKITGTTYKDFEPIGGFDSGAEYSGNCAGDHNSIQLRSDIKTGYPGLISSLSGGNLVSLAFDWNSNTSSGRTIQIFGSNVPIESSKSLFDGTLDPVGTVTTSDTLFEFDSEYQYFGIRSKSGALYLNSISVTWSHTDIVPVESVSIVYDGPTTITSFEQTIQLEANVLPLEATFKDVVWTSSDYEILDVSSNGLVTPISNGNATITVTSASNDQLSDSIDLVVDAPQIFRDYVLTDGVLPSGGYPDNEETFSDNRVAFGYSDVMKRSKGGFQFKANSGSLRNIDAVDRLAFVTLTRSSSSGISEDQLSYLTVKFGTSPSTVDTVVDYVLGENGTDHIFYLPTELYSEAAYFKIENPQSRAAYCTSIEVHTISDDEVAEAENWAQGFLDSGLCDGGITAPDTSLWSSLAETYSSMSLEAQYYVSGFEGNEAGESVIEQMIARYEYIVAKYGSSVYDDFMERSPEPSSYGYNAGALDNAENSEIWAAVIALFACTAVLGGAFLIKRRRAKA